ncbi:MAG: hypothetical protein PHD43_19320 [Methylococcales bacterium]|nr:hypothetical protein [Methylococcales bacterium]
MNFLLDATDAVLTWEISEEGFADAIKNQACLMSDINPEEISCYYSD